MLLTALLLTLELYATAFTPALLFQAVVLHVGAGLFKSDGAVNGDEVACCGRLGRSA